MKYSVGEILIVRPCVHPAAQHLVGTECRVIETSEAPVESRYNYLVHCEDGRDWWAAEHQLRRPGEPVREREKVVEWRDCEWMPDHVRARVENERASEALRRIKARVARRRDAES